MAPLQLVLAPPRASHQPGGLVLLVRAPAVAVIEVGGNRGRLHNVCKRDDVFLGQSKLYQARACGKVPPSGKWRESAAKKPDAGKGQRTGRRDAGGTAELQFVPWLRRLTLELRRRAWRMMIKMHQEMPSVATHATSKVIRIHDALMRASRVVMRPTPKHEKMKARSSCMPSTASSMLPSLPRSALPLPQTDTNVVDAVHMRFAQIEMVTMRCSMALREQTTAGAKGGE